MLGRRSPAALLAVPFLLHIARPACADAVASYPNHSVRIIVPYPPGGGGDAIARVLAPGAALTVNPQLMKVPYDPVTDQVPVTMLTRAVMVFCVNPKLPIKNVSDLVAYTKANPGKFNFGSAGNGTITQLSWDMLKIATGIDLTHVPYKGSGPAINDVMGGRIQGAAESMLLPYIKAGLMTLIGIGGDKRWALLPDVPSMAEQGYPSVRPSAWYSVFSPKGHAAGDRGKAFGGVRRDHRQSGHR